MPTLIIEGREIEVDNSFLSLTPEAQNATVDEIATSISQSKDKPDGDSDEGWTTGTIIPVRSRKGEIEFALPKIITEPIDIIKDSINMVGKVRSGEMPVMDPMTGHINLDVIRQTTDLAAIATPAARGGGLARGGISKKLESPATPLTEGQNAALAADRLGVEMPRAVASDSMTVNQFGKTATSLPVVGNSLRKGSQKAIDQLDDAATAAQNKLGAGDTAGAGELVRGSLTKTAEVILPSKVRAHYDLVDDLVDHDIKGPLSKTQRTAGMINYKNKGASLPKSKAVMIVDDAMQQEGGMTYEGIKALRTRIGEMLDDLSSVANSGTSQKELKSIYASLSDDMGAIALKSGPEAKQAWLKANKKAAKVAKTREMIDKVIGKDKSDERIISDLVAMTSTSSRANASKLLKLRNSMDKESWQEFSAAALAQMGRDPSGKFSPDTFVTAWGKTSKAGKSLMFGGEVSKSLDDIALVSARFKKMNQYANPSGTGQHTFVQTAAGVGFAGSAYFEPVAFITAAIGGGTTMGITKLLSNPTRAKKLAKWALASERAAQRPTTTNISVLSRLSTNLAIDMGVEKSLAKEFSVRTLAALNLEAPQNGVLTVI